MVYGDILTMEDVLTKNSINCKKGFGCVIIFVYFVNLGFIERSLFWESKLSKPESLRV